MSFYLSCHSIFLMNLTVVLCLYHVDLVMLRLPFLLSSSWRRTSSHGSATNFLCVSSVSILPLPLLERWLGLPPHRPPPWALLMLHACSGLSNAFSRVLSAVVISLAAAWFVFLRSFPCCLRLHGVLEFSFDHFPVPVAFGVRFACGSSEHQLTSRTCCWESPHGLCTLSSAPQHTALSPHVLCHHSVGLEILAVHLGVIFVLPPWHSKILCKVPRSQHSLSLFFSLFCLLSHTTNSFVDALTSQHTPSSHMKMSFPSGAV